MATPEQQFEKDLDKKLNRAQTLFDNFKQGISHKQTDIRNAARDAARSLKSTKTSEANTLKQLDKAKTDTTAILKKAETDTAKAAETAKTKITTATTEISKVRADAKREYGLFSTTYRAAMDGKKGIAARLKDTIIKHDAVKDAHDSVVKTRKVTELHATEIAEHHKNATENNTTIETIKNRAEEVRTEIENTYGITVDTTLAGSIITRKEELNSILNFWRWAMIISFAALVVTILVLVVKFPAHNLTELIQERLAYVTPLVVIIAVAYRQYNQERRLIEEYAFKAALAQALRGYTVLLSGGQYDDEQSREKILGFILTTMTNIFDRSSLDSRHGFIYHLVFGNNIARFEAKIAEQVHAQLQHSDGNLPISVDKKIVSTVSSKP